jgi:hypothetical protein
MNFYDLPISDKIALVNIAIALWDKGLVVIQSEQLDQEEIIDALVSEASILFNKSRLLKTP